MSDSPQLFSVEATRLFANRYMPDSGKRRLHEACDEIERLEEQLEAKEQLLHHAINVRLAECESANRGLIEQLEAAHRGIQELIIKNDRLNAACEAADRLLDDVYAKGEKHQADLLRVRTEVSAALATSIPASSPSIDGEEPCTDCGAPRKQGCGCWLDRPDHPWASAPARSPEGVVPTAGDAPPEYPFQLRGGLVSTTEDIQRLVFAVMDANDAAVCVRGRPGGTMCMSSRPDCGSRFRVACVRR